MKKFMIAAAAAAMVGVASAELCWDTTESAGCGVWDVKISLKTLTPKAAKFAGQSGCVACKEKGTKSCCFYLEQGTRTIEGILWQCQKTCWGNADDLNVVLWEKAYSLCWSTPLHHLTEYSSYLSADTVEDIGPGFNLFDRYSKKADKIEMVWDIASSACRGLGMDKGTDDLAEKYLGNYVDGTGEIEITAAGFGKFDAKNLLVKSISGNCAGAIVPVPVNCASCEYDTTYGEAFPYAPVFELCDEFDNWCDLGANSEPIAAASGTWSVKYNSSLSKGKKSLKTIIPTYAQE